MTPASGGGPGGGSGPDGPEQHGVLRTTRLELPLFAWEVARAVVGGRRLADWAPDYPADGDRMIAGMVEGVGRSPAGQPADRWGHRHVIERAGGLLVGGIGFHAPPEDGSVELGYGIVPSRRGRGYATEAVLAMVDLAWSDPDVDTVRGQTDRDNLASQRVLIAAGFRPVPADQGVAYLLSRGRPVARPGQSA